MPDVTPRQIIEAIDAMFGQPLNELELPRHYKQAEVRALLSLLDQLPNELITLPFTNILSLNAPELRC